MKKLKYFIVVPALFLMTACGKKEMAQAPAAEQPVVAVQTQQAAAVEDFIPDTGNYGTITQCPVMGEKIVVGKDTKAFKYKGKVYYMCCPSCAGHFKLKTAEQLLV